MSTVKHYLPAIFALLILGCSEASPSEPSAEPLPDAPKPTERVVYSLHFGPFQTVPGAEGVVCLDVPGPSEDIWVGGWHSEAIAVHHANIFARTTGAPFSTPTECSGGADMGDAFFGASRPLTEVHFGQAPEYRGSAMRLAHASSLIWDVHYLNTTDAPEEATVDVDFYEATEHSRQIQRFNFNGGSRMAIPVGATKTLTFSCAGPPTDTPVLTATSHVHAHNTLTTLSFGGKEAYRSTDWAEPATARFDSLGQGDLVVPAGIGATWSCEIRNTTSVTIGYSNDIQTGEMCILAGLLIGEERWACRL